MAESDGLVLRVVLGVHASDFRVEVPLLRDAMGRRSRS